MKTITTITFITVLSTAISCCGSKKSSETAAAADTSKVEGTTEKSKLDGTYRIKVVGGDDWSGKDLTLTFDSETGNLSGTTECNQLSATYTVRDDRVEFGPVIQTKMYCEGKMDAEKAIVQTLDDIGFFYIESGELNLCRTEDKSAVVLVATKE